ncbi:hypothetical protein BKA69DRAFT_1039132 [Paraphysoderma sedebokerense]|nr:hypothetical protein BKA69DRAFT_1039132 [Paraphysoderma sedebokerense]
MLSLLVTPILLLLVGSSVSMPQTNVIIEGNQAAISRNEIVVNNPVNGQTNIRTDLNSPTTVTVVDAAGNRRTLQLARTAVAETSRRVQGDFENNNAAARNQRLAASLPAASVPSFSVEKVEALSLEVCAELAKSVSPSTFLLLRSNKICL